MTYSLPGDFESRAVGIIGAGTLGRRIALMVYSHGGNVRMFDKNADAGAAAKEYVTKEAETLMKDMELTKAGTIEVFDDLKTSVQNCWLVIEAIPEVLEIKKQIFKDLESMAPADAILSSNSSSFPSSEFIDDVSEEGRKRVTNTHFYMPPAMNVVEVGSCGHTDQGVLDALLDTLPKYGFSSFFVHKDSIGFIFNRVWAAVKRECLEVYATGVSNPKDIDGIFMVNFHSKAGPFTMMDKVGLDVVRDIETHYIQANPSLPNDTITLLEKYIDKGYLGMKSGQGFYKYDDNMKQIGLTEL